MAISWSDAVADADNSDDLQRYQRAVSQVYDLEPLVVSFADAVRRAGKWPQDTADEYTGRMTDGRLVTRTGNKRHVWIHPDGRWGIETNDFASSGILGFLMQKMPGEEPHFGSGGRTSVIVAADFPARMDAMEQTKDWVPRELVAYLRAEGIPMPS